MNVAVATSTVLRPFAFMTPRGSDAVDSGADTRTPTSGTLPQTEAETAAGTEPLVNRFPTIAFSYDTDASRLVMLYRDPANGKTVSQIPTEAALKQYKEAQQKEKDAERASLLKLTVGESGRGGQAGGQAGGRSAAYGGGGTDGPATAGTATGSTPRTAAPVTATASAAAAFVAHSASVATSSAGTSANRVNVVI